MNTTTQQRTVKARRVNTAQTAGQHFTVTRVVRDPGDTRCFGFGISDDGQTELYISALIIKAEQMTEADVGAGFTCMIRANKGFDTEGHPHAVHPIKWDGEAEDVVITETVQAEPDPDTVPVEEFDELAALCAQYLDNVSGPAADMVDRLDKLTQGAGVLFAEAKQIKAALDKMQAGLDRLAPVNE